MANSKQLQMLASLLSQKYPNAQQDINQEVITPPVIPNTPWTGPSTPWGSPATIVNPPGPVPPGGTSQQGGGGRGDTTSGQVEGQGAGQMSPGMRAGLGIAGFGMGLAGLGPASIAAGILGAINDYAAGPFAANPLSGAPTQAGIQSAYDYSGNLAGAAAQAARDAAEAARAASVGPGIMGTEGGPRSAETPDSPTDTESGANGPGPGGNTEGGNPSGSTAGNSDTSSSESGNAWALGGAKRFTGPSRPLVAEAGPETAVFVPDFMAKMGLQGREQEVIQALRTMLRMLEGNQRSASSSTTTKESANVRRG